MDIRKRSVETKSGKLEMTILQDGKLVLGQLKGDRIYQYDLIRVLKENGIVCGYLEQCLGLIEGGLEEQIPIAQAFVDDEPGTYIYLFEQNFTHDDLISMVRSGNIPPMDLLQPVKKNDVLVEVADAPHTILKYPDGTRQVINELAATDMKYFSGNNTIVNEKDQNIQATIDGCAHRTPFGDVHVHPMVHVKSVGKAHGRLRYSEALAIENDIRSEADISSESNIHVGGMIRAAKVQAAGNVSCRFGLDNFKRLESAQIIAGQSLFAESVRQYKVRVGIYVLVRNVIDGSIIKSLRTVVASKITNSEIRIGHSLYAREITNGCKIYIGRSFVNDPIEKEMNTHFHMQQKILRDIEAEIEFIQGKLKLEQANTVKQLNKLKRLSPESISSDVLLKKYLKNQQSMYAELKNKISQYEKQTLKFIRERMRISFFESQYQAAHPPVIVVTGRLEAGTQINVNGQRMRTEKDLHHVKICISQETGKIEVKPLAV